MLPHTIFHAGVIIYELSASVTCFLQKNLLGEQGRRREPGFAQTPHTQSGHPPLSKADRQSIHDYIRHQACTQGPAVPVGKTMLGGVEPRGTRASKAPQGSAVGRGVCH